VTAATRTSNDAPARPFEARPRVLPLGDCLAIVVLAFVGLLVLHPALSAGFVLIDDHEIVGFAPGARNDPELRPLPATFVEVVLVDAAGGRFRPLYWLVRYSEIAVLGTHAAQWHALYVGLGILAAGLFYPALCAATVRGLPAFLASLWLLVVPGASSVACRGRAAMGAASWMQRRYPSTQLPWLISLCSP